MEILSEPLILGLNLLFKDEIPDQRPLSQASDLRLHFFALLILVENGGERVIEFNSD